MMKRSLAVLCVIAGIGAGCEAPEQSSVFIEGALAINPADDCVVEATSELFTSGALLDIGQDAGTANQAIIAAKVRSNLPAAVNTQTVQQDRTRSPNLPNYGQTDTNLINFTASEIFFTTDADRDGDTALEGPPQFDTPVNENTARVTGLGGSVFNDQTQLLQEGVVFVTAITAADAATLQNQPFIQQTLQNDPSRRARVIANIRLIGQTSGDSQIVSLPFSFPVDLCQGCLVPDCAGGQLDNTGTCVQGQDFPSLCVP